MSQGLVLYKRAGSARDDDDVDRVRDEVLDRYGSLPPQAENLFEVIRLKIMSRKLGIAAVDVVRGEIVLQVAAKSQIEPERLVHVLSQPALGLRVGRTTRSTAPRPSSRAVRCRCSRPRASCFFGSAPDRSQVGKPTHH